MRDNSLGNPGNPGGLGDLGEEAFAVALAGAQVGDEDAFRALFRAYQPRLLRYLRALVGAEAEDVASETWANVIRGLRRFSGGEPDFRAWLFTIARRRRADIAKALHRRPNPVLVDPVESPDRLDSTAPDTVENAVGEILSTEAAVRLVGRLPREQAEVVLLRHLAGFDVATTADILGKSPGAVRILAHRGLRRLADLVGGAPDPAQRVSGGVTR